MTGWTRLTGPAAHLPGDNIDTDQLIPARFMSAPRADGYGQFLLRDATPPPKGTRILIAGRNFGCGSSREAAVYALVDFGINAVIAPSFGDIFAANAVNNALAPIVADTDGLTQGEIVIDLDRQTITQTTTRPFRLDPIWRTKLINGWDDIDLTAQYRRDISAFADTYHTTAPWTRAGENTPQQGETP